MWVFVALGVGIFAANPDSVEAGRQLLPGLLLAIFAYWQIIPILMVSTGVSLDLSRLLPYPIPRPQLFLIELALRITTALEMVLVTAALFAGLLLNPAIPLWAPLALLPFGIFNLFVSIAVRDLLTRWLEKKGFREAFFLIFVLLMALPQILAYVGPPEWLENVALSGGGAFWPWSSAARIASGSWDTVAAAVLLCWTAAGWLFSRSQFERSLRFDAAAARSSGVRRRGWDIPTLLASIPALLLRDPVANLAEKEVKTLIRSPRFRLVFIMGFTFGLLIWWPLAFADEGEGGLLQQNYLTVVALYALMLLGEPCIWNTLGMDRSAIQLYLAAPLNFRSVLLAKNFAACVFIVLQFGILAAVCVITGVPVTWVDVVEAVCVLTVCAILLLAGGNLLSTRHPRPADPTKSWRTSSSGQVQLYLIPAYLSTAVPIALAYGARYAFDSDAAFYGVLAIDLAIALAIYKIALDSAVETMRERREGTVAVLGKAEQPFGG
jgi:ABC-2 type transport system permease protein